MQPIETVETAITGTRVWPDIREALDTIINSESDSSYLQELEAVSGDDAEALLVAVCVERGIAKMGRKR